MIADTLVVLSLALSVVAACLLAYDAIWAQGARFQEQDDEWAVQRARYMSWKPSLP